MITQDQSHEKASFSLRTHITILIFINDKTQLKILPFDSWETNKEQFFNTAMSLQANESIEVLEV